MGKVELTFEELATHPHALAIAILQESIEMMDSIPVRVTTRSERFAPQAEVMTKLLNHELREQVERSIKLLVEASNVTA